MSLRLTVPEAAKQTGISEYSLRMGCKQGRYPHIVIGGIGTRRKILIDIDLLEQYLKQEAIENVSYKGPDEVVNYGMLRRVKE
ncbi:MAG: helix-turn-helix domain-containing protein [Lachnospiraceae bacterium]|jgi:hypothetical protein|nr:helix-turn-helix domain-containing protein [Lachnospiraceae bacterium]